MEQEQNYFKFENWWLGKEGFNDRTKKWWSSFNFFGKPEFILASKLNALKHKLKVWSKSEQENLRRRRRGNLLNKLAEFDSIMVE